MQPVQKAIRQLYKEQGLLWFCKH
uniref:Uncharacterized protein n=1 Tax=Arundo donax TaxID=35708 RepID=A0A0A9HFH4_ARUDO